MKAKSDGSESCQVGRLDWVISGKRQLKGDHQAGVHSDQVVLVEAGPGDQWPKTLKTTLSSRETTRLESTQIRWFS